MSSFEGLPKAEPEKAPENRQVTSRHTTIYGDKTYDVYKLIAAAAELPDESVPLSVFEELRDQNYWHDKKGKWIGPNDIIALAEKYNGNWNAMIMANLDMASHTARVRDADYEKYPVLLVGQDFVVDGMHRLTRAWIDKPDHIPIKRFGELPPEAESTAEPDSF